MRVFVIAAFLSTIAAASAGELDGRSHAWLPDDPKSPAPYAPAKPWLGREKLGDVLGNLLGVHDGRWDILSDAAAEGGPVLAGTFRRGAAEIQLRWHPGE